MGVRHDSQANSENGFGGTRGRRRVAAGSVRRRRVRQPSVQGVIGRIGPVLQDQNRLCGSRRTHVGVPSGLLRNGSGSLHHDLPTSRLARSHVRPFWRSSALRRLHERLGVPQPLPMRSRYRAPMPFGPRRRARAPRCVVRAPDVRLTLKTLRAQPAAARQALRLFGGCRHASRAAQAIMARRL